MSKATERVQEYIRQFKRLRDTGAVIHSVHTDPKTEDAQLLLADVEALLEAAERYEDLEY